MNANHKTIGDADKDRIVSDAAQLILSHTDDPDIDHCAKCIYATILAKQRAAGIDIDAEDKAAVEVAIS